MPEGNERENTQQIFHLPLSNLQTAANMSNPATDISYSGTGDPGLDTGLPHKEQRPGVELWKFTDTVLNEFIFSEESPED